MFKNKEYRFFNNLYIPAIILILIYFFGSKSERYFRIAISLIVPIGATIYLYKRIFELELEQRKKINILIFTFLLELVFSIQIMFLGIPIIPYLPAPFNNLIFLGAIVTIICSSFWKKEEYNKGLIKLTLIICWALIFLYQFSINFIKIKEMW